MKFRQRVLLTLAVLYGLVCVSFTVMLFWDDNSVMVRSETIELSQIRLMGERFASEHRSQVGMNVTWITECGCTGMEIESSNLVYAIYDRVPNIAINKCNNRCPGYPDEVDAVIQSVSSETEQAARMGVTIAHFAYRGVCGLLDSMYMLQRMNGTFLVSRSMIESNAIDYDAVARCEEYDQVWVPNQHNYDLFYKSGVPAKKLRIVPEAVDVRLFNPAAVAPMYPPEPGTFVFLSVFKFEDRKNWRLLVRAFLTEFKDDDKVLLIIKTNRYMGAEPEYTIDEFIRYGRPSLKEFRDDGAHSWKNRIRVIEDDLPTNDMPRIFASAHAFVLPSFGEGWGLPIIEAMAMALPTIATGWGGSTAFMNSDNAYPIDFELVPSADGFEWAQASLDHTKALMRAVYSDQEAAKQMGRVARESVVDNFSHAKVADVIVSRLAEIGTGNLKRVKKKM